MKSRYFISLLLLCCFINNIAGGRVYTFVPKLNIRAQLSGNSAISGHLRHGRWVDVMEKTGVWTKVVLPSKQTGYVSSSLVTNVWMKVLKKESLSKKIKYKKLVIKDAKKHKAKLMDFIANENATFHVWDSSKRGIICCKEKSET